LLPGIIICGVILIVSFTIAMITKNWLSEILFFINIVLVLYYIYPIFYSFIG
ncbi:TPA: type II toxin-antitoxin system antitoxin TsaA, partial [Staphylococcus aureus]